MTGAILLLPPYAFMTCPDTALPYFVCTVIFIFIDKLFKIHSTLDVAEKQSSRQYSRIHFFDVFKPYLCDDRQISVSYPQHGLYTVCTYNNINGRGTVVASDTRELCRCSSVSPGTSPNVYIAKVTGICCRLSR
jgi:hypothetical protein